MSTVKLIQKCLRTIGYEVRPYPPPGGWVKSRDLLQKLLLELSIDCVFDLGANHGQFGDQLRDIGYQRTILSFEPRKAHFEVLSKRAAARPPWKAFPYALGSQNARAELSVGETIEVRRLDSVFNECMEGLSSHRLYLKLGAQGSEALQGAQGVLDKFLAAQSEPIYQGVPSSLESLREFRRNAFDVVDFMPV